MQLALTTNCLVILVPVLVLSLLLLDGRPIEHVGPPIASALELTQDGSSSSSTTKQDDYEFDIDLNVDMMDNEINNEDDDDDDDEEDFENRAERKNIRGFQFIDRFDIGDLKRFFGENVAATVSNQITTTERTGDRYNNYKNTLDGHQVMLSRADGRQKQQQQQEGEEALDREVSTLSSSSLSSRSSSPYLNVAEQHPPQTNPGQQHEETKRLLNRLNDLVVGHRETPPSGSLNTRRRTKTKTKKTTKTRHHDNFLVSSSVGDSINDSPSEVSYEIDRRRQSSIRLPDNDGDVKLAETDQQKKHSKFRSSKAKLRKTIVSGVPHYSKIVTSHLNHHSFNKRRPWHDTHVASISIGQEEFDDYGRGGLNSAIIAIIFGIGATGVLIVIVSHKMRSIKRRIAIKGQRRSLVPDTDFLINTIPI